jgi:hypothetical protein
LFPPTDILRNLLNVVIELRCILLVLTPNLFNSFILHDNSVSVVTEKGNCRGESGPLFADKLDVGLPMGKD